MIYTGNQDVSTAGTRVALASSRTIAAWVIVQSKAANVGTIYVAGIDVSSSNGIDLLGGDSTTFPSMGAIHGYDLQHIYIDASVNGEGVKFTYGRF
jgi:hypothetical protein